MRQHHRKRRWTIAGLALVLLAGMVLTIPGIALAGTIEYEITFVHPDGTTTTVDGITSDKNAFVPDAGGTDKDNPTGVTMHLSCSDDFPGGWGKKEGPDQRLDSAWRVQSFTIFKDGKLKCGTPRAPQPPPDPDIDIEKATNGFDADDPTGPQIPVGDTVTWTYVVTNTGDVPLYDSVVTDDKLGEIGIIDVLAPGESQTLEEFGTAEEGQYRNDSKVVGTARIPLSVGTVGTQAKGKYAAFLFQDINSDDVLFFTTDRVGGDQFFAELGGTSQDSPIGMTMHLSCSDEFAGGWGEKKGPQPGRDSAFNIEAFWIYEVKKDGEVKTKCGSPFPVEEQVMDEDPSHYIGVPGDPKVKIEKATNGFDADEAPGPRVNVGDPITWTYVVTNIGDVDLEDLVVTDDKEGTIGEIDFLAVGDSATLTKLGTALRMHQYANLGCVVGYSVDDGTKVEDCDPSHYNPPGYYDGEAAIDLEKATNGEDADLPTGPRIPVGDKVTWTYEVTNTGEQMLYGIFLYDEQEGRVDCPKTRLAAGQSMTCRVHGWAEAGQYMNVAWVDAWGDDGSYVSDEDPSHYFGVADDYHPAADGIDLEFFTNDRDADHPNSAPSVKVGSEVAWTYRITNTGNNTLYGVFLYHEGEGQVHCPKTRLAPGESMTCSMTGHAGNGLNAAMAWADAWSGDTYVSDEDPSHHFGIGYES